MDRPVTILVIDDEAAMGLALARGLSRRGYRVYTAATVPEAEALLCDLGASAIHLVIADIHLSADPQVHEGYALYQRWHAAHPILPFLLMSGDPNTLDLPAVRLGTVHFLAKPFSLSALLQRLQEALGGQERAETSRGYHLDGQ